MNFKFVIILLAFYPSFITEAKSEIIPIKVYFDNDWVICKPNDAVYYRISQWNNETKSYEGKFTDYLMNNTVVVEGNYSQGKKNGLFIFNYENGLEKISAYFKNNKPDSLWVWYYPDKTINFKISFSKEEFNIIELNDSNGKSLLEKHTFIYKFRNDKLNTNLKIKGDLADSQKEGKWKILNKNETLGFDLYKKNALINTKVNSGSAAVNDRLIKNSLFTPYSIYACESLFLNENISDIDYPFLRHLFIWLPIEHAQGLIGDSAVFGLDKKPRYINGSKGINMVIAKNLNLTKNVNNNCKNWGNVYYEITINENGFVIDKKIIKSPDSLLNNIALEALEPLGRFKPAYLNQKPIKSRIVSKIKFSKPIRLH